MRVYKVGFILGVSFSFIYILASFYWASHVEIIGDRLEYFYKFSNIVNDPFPWSLEYFTSSLMWLVNWLGLDFRGFLFVNYIIWLPVVYTLFYKSEKDIFLLLIGIFFLTYLFFIGSSYLIRQYSAFMFFIYYYFSENKKIKYISLGLALFSHLSSILFILLSTRKISSLIMRFRKVIFIFFIPLCFFDFVLYFKQFSQFISSKVNFVSFESKVAGANQYIDGLDLSVQTTFVVLNLVIIFAICFSRKGCFEKRLLPIFSLILISSMLYVILRNEPIMANRVAFVTFSFIIPSLILVLRSYYVKFKQG